MTDYDFILFDRIAKIRAINELYDLENNSYISFSGGKDSTILHYLIDMALPNEYKQCELLWKPVYDEYRSIGYRLSNKIDKQCTIWELLL